MTTQAKCTCTEYGWCRICRPEPPAGFNPTVVLPPPRRSQRLDYHLVITGDTRAFAAMVLDHWVETRYCSTEELVDRLLATFIIDDAVEVTE